MRRPASPKPPQNLRSSRGAGFTLIEVLVALFIMATMAAMAWQGVDMVMRSRDIAQVRMEGLLRVQSALSQWEIDLRETFDTGIVPGFSFDGASLRLTRRQPQGAQVVVWSLRDQTLQRWAAEPTTQAETLQELWLQTYQLQGRERSQIKVLDGVSQWQVYQYSQLSNAWSNAQSSGDVQQGSSGTRQLLPDGVRLLLQFSPGSGMSGQLTRDLRLVHP
ncbi:MAG: hypothetical protein RJA44_87 [Pseudomonadota bacterium]|jgi:general secretion pathway protein J